MHTTTFFVNFRADRALLGRNLRSSLFRDRHVPPFVSTASSFPTAVSSMADDGLHHSTSSASRSASSTTGSEQGMEEPESSEPRARETGIEEPRWLTRTMLDAMHADLLRRHGGLPGVNADGLISLALARPRDRWATKEQRPDLADLASAYGYALSKNAGYRDCNLHVAFLAMYVFLGLNGLRLEAPLDAPIPKLMRGLASNGPDHLATWIRKHLEER